MTHNVKETNSLWAQEVCAHTCWSQIASGSCMSTALKWWRGMSRETEREKWKKMIKGGVAICHFTLIYLLGRFVLSRHPFFLSLLSSQQREGVHSGWCSRCVALTGTGAMWSIPYIKANNDLQGPIEPTTPSHHLPPHSLGTKIRFWKIINMNLKERESKMERGANEKKSLLRERERNCERKLIKASADCVSDGWMKKGERRNGGGGEGKERGEKTMRGSGEWDCNKEKGSEEGGGAGRARM